MSSKAKLSKFLVAILLLPITLLNVNQSAHAQVQIPSLGTAENFAFLAGNAFSIEPALSITGVPGAYVGEFPGITLNQAAVTFLLANTSIAQIGNEIAGTAAADTQRAFVQFNALATTIRSGEVGAGTGGVNVINPGVYEPGNTTTNIADNSAITASTDIILDAQGDPNAKFVFISRGGMITTAGITVVLRNGANASNVFWIVNADFTTGAGTIFRGSVIAQAAATLGAATILTGRVLCLINCPLTVGDGTVVVALASQSETARLAALAAQVEATRLAGVAAQIEADRVAALAAQVEITRLATLAAQIEADRLAALAAQVEATRLAGVAAQIETDRLTALAAQLEITRLATLAAQIEVNRLAALAAQVETTRIIALAAQVEATRVAALAAQVEATRVAALAAQVEVDRLLNLSNQAEAVRLAALEAQVEAARLAKLVAQAEATRLATFVAKVEADRLAVLTAQAEATRLATLVAKVEADRLALLTAVLPSAAVTSPTVKSESFIKPVGSVYFSTGSFTLTSESKRVLTLLISKLVQAKVTKIAVFGYTDAQGVNYDNKALSIRRANAVATYIRSKGISTLLRSTGKGILKTKNLSRDVATSRRVDVLTR